MLFNKLPDEIFKPLAGANRYLFEEILLFLFRYFSDEDLTNEAVFPRRGHVIREIEELLFGCVRSRRRERCVRRGREEIEIRSAQGDDDYDADDEIAPGDLHTIIGANRD